MAAQQVMRRIGTSPSTVDRKEHTASAVSAALIKRVAGGDESAFATLYDTTCGLIYGLLLRILRDSKTVEQVLLDVYEEVWAQAATYDKEHEKPMTWLIMMARDKAIARIRTGDQEHECQTCRSVAPASATTICSSTDEMISNNQRIARAALATLSTVQQQTLELAYFSGLSQNEIAARFDLSLHSLQLEMRAGMMRLRSANESHQFYP